MSRKHKRRGLLPALADQSWNSLTLYPPLKVRILKLRIVNQNAAIRYLRLDVALGIMALA